MAKAPRPRGWSTKRNILAALPGALVTGVVVIAVSAVLTPAEVVFTVTNATRSEWELQLILSANDTSHRAWVDYHSFIVYLVYTAKGTVYKVPADVAPPTPQRPGTTANMSVSASFALNNLPTAGEGGGTPEISVLVLAVVRFTVGPAYTRPYDVRVLCDPVDYFGAKNLSFPVRCAA
ncbi:hypothetical protein CFC21_095695 [Triticum aestivum]|uniref:Late embryogenesis abundant protein LEA-2 subgroup domain-containing protein n=2 Tax=Triticum aestivum TaxID=4565 RepID=A0A9R1LQP1_WHEAT|nr:hypothetical protein CFC21_095695 [Triticum aestivum]